MLPSLVVHAVGYETGVPSRSFLVGSDRVGRGRATSRDPVYPQSEKEVGVGLCPHLGQAFQLDTGSLFRPVIMYLGRPRCALSLHRLLGRVLQGSRSIRDPKFMNPIGALSPFRTSMKS